MHRHPFFRVATHLEVPSQLLAVWEFEPPPLNFKLGQTPKGSLEGGEIRTSKGGGRIGGELPLGSCTNLFQNAWSPPASVHLGGSAGFATGLYECTMIHSIGGVRALLCTSRGRWSAHYDRGGQQPRG